MQSAPAIRRGATVGWFLADSALLCQSSHNRSSGTGPRSVVGGVISRPGGRQFVSAEPGRQTPLPFQFKHISVVEASILGLKRPGGESSCLSDRKSVVEGKSVDLG